VGGVVEESAKTGGHAIRDGFVTFGRTVRAFFTGGGRAAKETWHENAARTRADAREGGLARRRPPRGRRRRTAESVNAVLALLVAVVSDVVVELVAVVAILGNAVVVALSWCW